MARRAKAPFARKAWLLALVLTAACRGSGDGAAPADTSAERGKGGDVSPCTDGDCSTADSAGEEHDCSDPLPVYDNGSVTRRVCEKDAHDLTVIDLSDSWAPRVLQGSAETGPVPYRDVYIAL